MGVRARAVPPPGSPAAASRRAVLLASEGRPYTREAVRLAAQVARDLGGEVRVLMLARMWGTAFGLPHPGLRPNKREMAEHESNVADAIEGLRALGVEADGHIISTRKATKSILGEARRVGCETIVMDTDPPRSRLVADFMWSQEAYRIRRRAAQPVHLVVAGTAPSA